MTPDCPNCGGRIESSRWRNGMRVFRRKTCENCSWGYIKGKSTFKRKKFPDNPRL